MIVVDDARWMAHGRRWAHLTSTTDFAELHDFAEAIGKRRVGFQGDHYDVDEAERERALAAGAVRVSSREIVRALRVAGLRRSAAKPRLDNALSERCQLGHIDELLAAAPRLETRCRATLGAAADTLLARHFADAQQHAVHLDVFVRSGFAAAVVTLCDADVVGRLAPFGGRAQTVGRELGISEVRAPATRSVSWVELLLREPA